MIALIGSTGWVGSHFEKAIRQKDIECLNLTRENTLTVDSFVDAFSKHRPEFVINAAGFCGFKNIDDCETHPGRTISDNVEMPGRCAIVCRDLGIPMGHISTGAMFNSGTDEFSEDSRPNFDFSSPHCSFYAGSKSLCEKILMGIGGVYIWRINMPFTSQASPKNILTKLMAYDKVLNMVNSLTDLEEAVDGCLHLANSYAPLGIYNMVNTASVDTMKLTSMIQKLVLPEKRWQFISKDEFMSQIQGRAPRQECVLSNEKAVGNGVAFSRIEEAIEKRLRDYQ